MVEASHSPTARKLGKAIGAKTRAPSAVIRLATPGISIRETKRGHLDPRPISAKEARTMIQPAPYQLKIANSGDDVNRPRDSARNARTRLSLPESMLLVKNHH